MAVSLFARKIRSVFSSPICCLLYHLLFGVHRSVVHLHANFTFDSICHVAGGGMVRGSMACVCLSAGRVVGGWELD